MLQFFFVLLFGNLPQSMAHEPSFPHVSLGTLPYAAYQGSVISGQSDVVFTVASGHDFLVTTAVMSSANCDLYQNSTQLVNGKSHVMSTNGRGVLLLGRAFLRVDAGSTLNVSAVGDDCTYFLSGYSVEMGSSYIHMTGEVSPNGMTDIATIPSGKTFVLQSIIVGATQPETCDLYIDGSMIVDGSLRVMASESAMHSAFTNGNIRIPVLENQTISMHNMSVSSTCHYYMEGLYVEP